MTTILSPLRTPRTTTEAAWRAEAVRLFGRDFKQWKFSCPSCGHVASVSDWGLNGAPAGSIGFSCVGRFLPATEFERAEREARTFAQAGGPCLYAGGGLILINPVTVHTPDGKSTRMFEFADATT